MIGLNANYLNYNLTDNPANTVYFDFGLIKKFELGQQSAAGHSLNLGASISNLNFGDIEIDFNGNKSTSDLPVINRYGIAYQFGLDKNWISDTLNTFELVLSGDYQLLLNSEYLNGFHSGLEITFLEVLSGRIGYYQESIFDYNLPNANENELSAFTYGFGIQLPLHKLTKLPFNLNFDYTNLPQPSYSKVFRETDNFSAYTIRLSWRFKD